MELIMLIEH